MACRRRGLGRCVMFAAIDTISGWDDWSCPNRGRCRGRGRRAGCGVSGVGEGRHPVSGGDSGREGVLGARRGSQGLVAGLGARSELHVPIANGFGALGTAGGTAVGRQPAHALRAATEDRPGHTRLSGVGTCPGVRPHPRWPGFRYAGLEHVVLPDFGDAGHSGVRLDGRCRPGCNAVAFLDRRREHDVGVGGRGWRTGGVGFTRCDPRHPTPGRARNHRSALAPSLRGGPHHPELSLQTRPAERSRLSCPRRAP